MAYGQERAGEWQRFILGSCNFPAPERLRAQFEGAVFSDFCECGCNSFAVKANVDAPPLIQRDRERGRKAIFFAVFEIATGRTLDITLLASGDGDLKYVQIECSANSYPVPDDIPFGITPVQTWASEQLLP
ncbi:MAG: hypothetical protein QNJ15_08070 [Erythrobacter sp.]|nr:hypothetical protein [Erythrobacter sp.]